MKVHRSQPDKQAQESEPSRWNQAFQKKPFVLWNRWDIKWRPEYPGILEGINALNLMQSNTYIMERPTHVRMEWPRGIRKHLFVLYPVFNVCDCPQLAQVRPVTVRHLFED